MSMVKPPTPMKTYAPALSEVDEVSAGGREHPIQPISPILSTKPGQVCYQIPALGSGSGVGHPAGSPFLHQLWKLPPLDVRPTPHLSYPHLPTVPLSFFSLALTRIEKTLVLPACLAHCLLSPQACERHEGRDSSPC